MRLSFRILLTTLLILQNGVQADEITTGVDEAAQLKYWQLANRDMSLRLVQRLPDQTRGFFLARGFNLKQVDEIANSCVFQTVFKNTSQSHKPSPLKYDLMAWQVILPDRAQQMKTREVWEKIWKQRGVSRAASIAFKWSLLPTRQVYRPGDYNWGMSIFDVLPGTTFDLKVVWVQHGKTEQAVIRNIRCAKDSDVKQDGGSR